MPTEMVDYDTHRFLRELDSFTRTPDLYDIKGDAVRLHNRSESSIDTDVLSSNISASLNCQNVPISLVKQPAGPTTRVRPQQYAKVVPTTSYEDERVGNQNMQPTQATCKQIYVQIKQPPSTSTPSPPNQSKIVTIRTPLLPEGEKVAIKKEESKQLRDCVLRANRPLNPWAEVQKISPDPGRVSKSPLNVQTLSNSGKLVSPALSSPLSNSATSTISSSGSSSHGNSVNSTGLLRWRPVKTENARSDSQNFGTSQSPISHQDPKTVVRNYRTTIRAVTPQKTVTSDISGVLRGKLFKDPLKELRDLKIMETSIPPKNQPNFYIQGRTGEQHQRPHVPAGPIIYGTCTKCRGPVTEATPSTQALNSLFHSSCFTCKICSRELSGCKFYHVNGSNVCEDDYKCMLPKCERCGLVVTDLLVQALGKSFHPACFRCHECKTCLDGIQFAADDDDHIYCIDDYHRLFTPVCSVCHLPIEAVNNGDQVVRVLAMGRNFHTDCYRCEGCSARLSNELGRECYPLEGHALCQRCHISWSQQKLSNPIAPTTQL